MAGSVGRRESQMTLLITPGLLNIQIPRAGMLLNKLIIIIYLVLLYAALAGTIFLPCSSPTPTLLLFFFNPFDFT